MLLLFILLYICIMLGTSGSDCALIWRVDPRIVGDGDISRGGKTAMNIRFG